MDDAIPLSVILVWSDPREGIAEALHSLVEQVNAVGGEILAVSAWVADKPEGFPGVRWLRVEAQTTEPRAWEIGQRAARGETLAFGQARCRYDPGWVAAILRERSQGASLVAGPVELAGGGWSARAAHLCDYALVGPGGGAAACNLAVDRAILPEPEADGLPKTALLERGSRITWAPEMVATTRVIGTAWSGWRARFRRGRSYAARRASRWPNRLRLPAGLGCVALPGLLYARMVGRGHRESWPTLTLGGPLVAASLGAWALGEWAGYWFGAGPGVRR